MSLVMSNEKLNSVTVARGHLEQEDELSHGECVAFPSVVLSSRPPSITSPGSTPWRRTQHSDSHMWRESHKVSPFYVGKVLLLLQFPICFKLF